MYSLKKFYLYNEDSKINFRDISLTQFACNIFFKSNVLLLMTAIILTGKISHKKLEKQIGHFRRLLSTLYGEHLVYVLLTL